MRPTHLLAAIIILSACSSPEPEPHKVPGPVDLLPGAKEFHVLDLPNQEDNIRHDTLLVQTTHHLPDGRYVMAARNKDDSREGLRLFLYTPQPDSSAAVIAISAPAYDSYTMLPTFYATGDTADGMVILANFGERDSWGQKVFWLKNRQFRDLGWLDVAHREWRAVDDSTFQRLTNIAPFTQVKGSGGSFLFTFMGDSVHLFDDLEGHLDRMIPAQDLAYRYDGQRMTLVVEGRERLPASPL